MFRSIRWRLQVWYAAVLLAIIGGFAGVMYRQARATTVQRIDLQLMSGLRYLDAALHSFPPHELDGLPPNEFDRPPPEWDDRQHPPPHQRPGDRPRPGGPGPGNGDHAERGPSGRDSFERGPPPRRLERESDQPMGGAFDPDRGPRKGPPPTGRRRSRSDLLGMLDLQSQTNMKSLESRNALAPGSRDEQPYFYVWQSNGDLLKSQAAAASTQDPAESTPAYRPNPTREVNFVDRGQLREVVGSGPRDTVILVGKSTAGEKAELAAFAWTLFMAGAVLLGVGCMGGWIISARVLRPISAISETASAISANSLSRRIDAGSTDRELIGLAQVLNVMFGRLESAFERQRRFTSDASHELRTPLAILYTNLELAISRPRTEEEYRETLETSLGAAARMRVLVDSLLMLARADAGHLDLDARPVDLRSIADDAVAQHTPLAAKGGIQLASDSPRTPVWVLGDAMFLARVASNLISNAIRHTPKGGNVRVSVTASAGQAVLAVADTGAGIPIDQQPRIFERFYRVDTARARVSGGNGLGLAICKTLVETHGGRISFTSQPGRGTTFIASFPLAES